MGAEGGCSLMWHQVPRGVLRVGVPGDKQQSPRAGSGSVFGGNSREALLIGLGDVTVMLILNDGSNLQSPVLGPVVITSAPWSSLQRAR